MLFLSVLFLSKEEAQTSSVLVIGIRKEAHSQLLHLSRKKRYTLTPGMYKWDKFKLTYKYGPTASLHPCAWPQVVLFISITSVTVL